MPRTSSTSWSVGDPVTAARLNSFNTEIDALYTGGSDRLRVWRLAADPAFQVTIGAGTYRVSSTEGQYAGGTFLCSASQTRYIMIDSAGAIQTSTVGWNSGYAKLAVVVTNGSAITSITNWRNDTVGGILGVANIMCRVYQNAATAMTTNVFTTIPFQAEDFDTDNMHDNTTNNSRITINTAGKYLCGGMISNSGTPAQGARILLNGTTVIAGNWSGTSSTNPYYSSVSTIYNFSATNYIELQGTANPGNNTSGSAITNFWATKID